VQIIRIAHRRHEKIIIVNIHLKWPSIGAFFPAPNAASFNVPNFTAASFD
jgi:hypothetical protein